MSVTLCLPSAVQIICVICVLCGQFEEESQLRKRKPADDADSADDGPVYEKHCQVSFFAKWAPSLVALWA